MIGRIVCSRAGADKGKFSVVVKIDNDRVFISDGKRHKLASPKAKNSKHIALTEKVLSMEEMKTDKAVRTALAVYRSNM